MVQTPRRPWTARHGRGSLLLFTWLLSACGTFEKDSAPSGKIDISSIPDAVPKAEPRSKYGNPGSYEVNGQFYYVLDSSDGYFERGTASWYGKKFHGRRTSSGEIYDVFAMTAAHRTLPLPTYVQVTNLENGRTVVVKINDRGPFHGNRLIDLSYAAAARLDMLRKGTAPVEIRAITPPLPLANASSDGIRAPATVEPGVTETPSRAARFYVQTGAFGNQRNAEMLRSTLIKGGADNTHIQQRTAVNGRAVYRVRVGPLTSREEAMRLKQRLAAEGIGSPHIVTE